MYKPGSAEPYPHDLGHRPSLAERPADDSARLFWESQIRLSGSEDNDDVRLLVEFHNARSRCRSWRGVPETEVTQEALSGMREVISRETDDAQEAGRRYQLIEAFALCYE